MECPSRDVPVQHHGVWYSGRDWHSGLWLQSRIMTSWAWGAADLCLCRGEDGKDGLGKLSTEGLCWFCALAEDTGPAGATEGAAAEVQPWLCWEHRTHLQCLRGSSALPCTKTGLRWNRERFHMCCGFSWLERARVEGRGRILLFVSSLLPLAISFCNCNL